METNSIVGRSNEEGTYPYKMWIIIEYIKEE